MNSSCWSNLDKNVESEVNLGMNFIWSKLLLALDKVESRISQTINNHHGKVKEFDDFGNTARRVIHSEIAYDFENNHHSDSEV